jgi:hypothetical protein
MQYCPFRYGKMVVIFAMQDFVQFAPHSTANHGDIAH